MKRELMVNFKGAPVRLILDDDWEERATVNCAVCGEDTGSSDMLCDDCHADADHDQFVDDCYNAEYDRSMY